MSISISSTTGFGRSISPSISHAPNDPNTTSFGGSVGGSNTFRKTFAVSSLKSLNRRQNYVLVLEFEKNLVSFHKVRRGREVKRSFPFHACVKLEREAKNACQLATTFGHDPKYKKALFFINPEERELFCNLVHAMIVSGNRAVKLFKSLQTTNGNANGNVSVESGDSVQTMDFCDFLISFSSAQTQLSNSSAMGTNGSGANGMTFDEEAELLGGRARANASDPQAALAFLTETNANGDGSIQINKSQTASLISLLNGRMLEGEKPINSCDTCFRVECSCGGIGHTVMFKRCNNESNGTDSSQGGLASSYSSSTSGSSSNGNVEISSKDGTGTTAVSRGLFLLTNYRILYINYHENDSFANHEASNNYTNYLHLPGSGTNTSSSIALLPNSPSYTSSPTHGNNHDSKLICSCDADIPLGLIARVSKSSSKQEEIKLSLKDGRKIEFGFDVPTKWVDGLITNIQKMAFPKDQTKLFAFQYEYKPQAAGSRNHPSLGLSPFGSNSATQLNGWDLYDALQDYQRISLSSDPLFRLVGLNVDFKLCASYPRWFITPNQITDEELKQIGSYRSQARLPAVVWIHPITRASLSRCAQPLVGIKGKRSELDEKLVSVLRLINPSNSGVLHIFDARPWKAAVGNTAMGKGFENIAHYEKATLDFMNIDNIHAIRHALEKLHELCNWSPENSTPVASSYYATSIKTTPAQSSAFLTSNSSAASAFDESFLSKLEGTLWLHYVRLVLAAAQRIAVAMSEEGATCITHCSDGWDRTSQLAALTELMLDPFYRTLEGFAILIEKEWLSFGHRFAERYGHGSHEHDDDQRAPIFTQFLDCVYQLLHQFPASFEFTDDYLLAIHDHVTSHRFGTFLFNCMQEREKNELPKKTVSLWTFLLHPAIRTKFYNSRYVHPPHIKRWNIKDVPAAQSYAAATLQRARADQALAAAAQSSGASNRSPSPPPSSTPQIPPLTNSPDANIIASFFCIPSVSAKRLVLWEKMHLRHEREYLRTQAHAQQQIANRVLQAQASKVMNPIPEPMIPKRTSVSSNASTISSPANSTNSSEIESAWMSRYNLLVQRITDAGLNIDQLESGIFLAKPKPTINVESKQDGEDSTIAAAPIRPSITVHTGPSASPSAPTNILVSAHPSSSPSATHSVPAPITTRPHRTSLSTSQLVTLKASIDERSLTVGRACLRNSFSSQAPSTTTVPPPVIISPKASGPPKRAPPSTPTNQPLYNTVAAAVAAATSPRATFRVPSNQAALLAADAQSAASSGVSSHENSVGGNHMRYASDSDSGSGDDD